ncbi:MAG: glycine cleavage system protein H, partial [Coriobacteriia bacterium]|nr:glycine cleavage system protein H [Coriobacteriia bacterium]
VGASLANGDTFGEIESVKSVSELISPVTGEVVEVNGALDDSPETVNSDPHGAGWMVKVKIADASGYDDLLTAEEYDAFVTEG